MPQQLKNAALTELNQRRSTGKLYAPNHSILTEYNRQLPTVRMPEMTKLRQFADASSSIDFAVCGEKRLRKY